MELEKVAILGLGALGTMYGKHMLDHGSSKDLMVLVDQDRKERYEREGVYCNNEKCDFEYVVPRGNMEPVDLIIVAVKFSGLEKALDLAVPVIGNNTVILSLLNGISSEEIIAERFGADKVVYCVAYGMDAVKMGNKMTYTNKGVLCFGNYDEQDQNSKKVEAVAHLFDRVHLPYEIDHNMKRKLWSKFMVNVGVNQTTMVYQTNYGGVQANGLPRETMILAMREVLVLSEAEKIGLTEEDIENWLKVIDGLDPEGMPSMRQDSVRGHKSEVELFSGKCIALGEKHHIPVPVNRYLYEEIHKMESGSWI